MPTSKKRHMVPVPADLHARLATMAADLQEAYEAGRTDRVHVVDQGSKGCVVPIHEVIRLCLDDYESHRQRSRKSRKKKQVSEAAAT